MSLKKHKFPLKKKNNFESKIFLFNKGKILKTHSTKKNYKYNIYNNKLSNNGIQLWIGSGRRQIQGDYLHSDFQHIITVIHIISPGDVDFSIKTKVPPTAVSSQWLATSNLPENII